MSGKKRTLNPEEKALWRRVAKTVTRPRLPLPEEEDEDIIRKLGETGLTNPNKPIKAPPVAPPAKSAPRKAATPAPADRGAEKRVRRGKLEIGGTLDLHGHTQDSGRAALVRFLHAAQRRGDATVIVVTGKGRAGEGALKRAFPSWLASAEIRPLISGFAQAHQNHGGAGAFYVFLKRPRN